MMRKYLWPKALCLLFVSFQFACSNSNPAQLESNVEREVVELTEKNFKDAAAQYKVLMNRLPEGRFPKTYHADTDSLETSNSGWWTSGFYPGTLLYIYGKTRDPEILKEAKRTMDLLKKEQYTTSTHDLGFMMYNSFGTLNRLEPSKETRKILLNSAKSLATRYSPKVGAIRSWDFSPKEEFWVIIDNMMNLELLFWATRETGDSTYYNIAVDHANTTMEHHFRPDYSSYHVIEYETATGDVLKKRTEQGIADESAWARGQAWALYGYTVMYRETKDKKYLEQAKNIAEFVLNHPNMPEDKIPYWDYNDPKIPDAPRDASAAAVIASALLELGTYVEGENAQEYFKAAETMIKNLSTDTYKAENGENGGFLLKHSVGHLPRESEVDVPLTYADYYFVEAMQRYQELKKK